MEFLRIVVIETDTPEHADQVLAERTGYDEDYGFDYTIKTGDNDLLATEYELDRRDGVS